VVRRWLGDLPGAVGARIVRRAERIEAMDFSGEGGAPAPGGSGAAGTRSGGGRGADEDRQSNGSRGGTAVESDFLLT
jgi:hypothetical protein